MTLVGCSNFREVGALGRQRLFRSDHLGALTASDASLISALGIRRVLDFRGLAERAAALCALPQVTVHSLPIEPTIVQVLGDLIAAGHQPTPAEAVSHMQETYRGFVRHNTQRFAELFGHLLESNEPTVFHCVAGKDRTGFAAALFLRSLGVSEADVMRDYLLTNERLKMPEVSRQGLAPEVAAVLWRVQPDFLNAAFEAVDEDYGSLEGYFREGLRLGPAQREKLRRLYL
jgi:protein-tyrosine phosphatase